MRTIGQPPGAGPDRYGVGASSPLGEEHSAWDDRLLVHFTRLGQTPDGQERLVQSSDAVLSTLRKAVEAGRWEPALNLARVAEPAFALGARWAAWATTLEVGLQAARVLGDREGQAWALHEQGVRAMALGHFDEADELLSQALVVRTELGAWDEAGWTRSQLEQLAVRRGAAS